MADYQLTQSKMTHLDQHHRLLKLFSFPLLDAPWKISIVSTMLSMVITVLMLLILSGEVNTIPLVITVVCASTISYGVSKSIFPYYLLIERQHQQLTVLNNRMGGELALANDIQRSLLPVPPRWVGLDIATFSQPAHEVGGDFYAFHTTEDGSCILSIGDISGKGVSAALLMATSLSSFNLVQSQQHLKPDKFLETLDKVLTPYTKPYQKSCALSYVQLSGRTLYSANAGGIPPFVRRATGDVEWPEIGGIALGQGLGPQSYEIASLPLSAGDLIIMTSDGLIETKSKAGEMFGFERLEQAIRRGPIVSAQAMLDYLLAKVSMFIEEHEPHDDITIVILQVKR
ncbi:MAG: PP2C family protein-serine/threonine phosphatase [Chloroflexota bacterium]